jgi:trans-2,3-dihydro-3-hydroxyanthranilate isomerase
MARPFHIVDVFAARAYAGNPLAVVVGNNLSEPTMQAIAAEMNFSETTFVSAMPDDGGHSMRIFTPAREIAFAGHPILGTAWVVRAYLIGAQRTDVRLDLAVGPVRVTFETGDDGNEVAWFEAPQVRYGETCAPALMADAIGVAPDDIDDAASSLVRVRARGGGGDARHVAVGGQVVPVVRGELTGEY